MKNLLLTTGLVLLIVVGYMLGKNLYLKPKNITGDQATEISGNLPDGSPFSLRDLRGQYVLLDFWGSWCMPCRSSHPQLVDFYRKMQTRKFRDAEGFQIVSIGIEQDKDNWLRAIEQDELAWPYQLVSLDNFDSPIPRSYHVKQIPTKFLIDPKGVIISVDPTLDEVAKLLYSRLENGDSQH